MQLQINRQDEEKLLEMLHEGNMRAFDALFICYQPQLVMFINGFVKDEELARDFSQDIFLRIWTNRGKMTDIQSFKGYLFKTARFFIYNYFDHQLVDQKYIAETLYLSNIETDEPEEQLFVKELDEMIDIAISHMPEKQRLVFEMSRKEGMTNQQIADALGISKHTVERHISNSLISIRKLERLMLVLFYF